MIDTLEHITITTGGSRHSRRSEVSDTTIEMIRTAVATGTRVHPPLDTPWLAVAMMAGALNAGRELLAECADLERCVAWMLLE